MAHFTDQASELRPDANHTTAQIPVGSVKHDTVGNRYMYVGASGVSLGAPVKHVGGDFSACIAGSAPENVLGVAIAEFPSTGYTYGFVGTHGTHPTKVPSGTSAGAIVVGGSATTQAASAPSGQSAANHPSKHGVTREAAENDGSAIDVFWF